MKVISKTEAPRVVLTTPVLGSSDDKTDRSLVGETRIDSIIKRYGEDIANWIPKESGVVVDVADLPSDLVDCHNMILAGRDEITYLKNELEILRNEKNESQKEPFEENLPKDGEQAAS